MTAGARTGEARMRYDLAAMRPLLARVGDPQRRLRAIHVVGTNGKTSAARAAAAALRTAGLRDGCFLSPWLWEPRDAVEVAGAALPAGGYAAARRLVEDAARAAERAGDSRAASAFEVETASSTVPVAPAPTRCR